MKRIVKISAFCIVMTLLASSLFCIPAQALASKTIVGTGAVGEGIGKQTTLVDFTASDLCGFEAIGNTAEPTFELSSAKKTNVLYTWMDSSNAETGIRGTLAKTALLQNASTLSVRLLAQYSKTETPTVILRLESLDKTGTPLIFEAETTASSVNWQTVTFNIASFVANATPDAPCTISVLTSSNAEDEQFVLWVHSLYTSSPEIFPEFIIPAITAAGGLILGFVLFFVIYRTTCKKNRRPRWEEDR